MKILYNLAFLIFGFFYFPFFALRLRQEKEKGRLLSQRIGFFSRNFREELAGKQVLWVHAVSVGEVFAARPLIEKLERQLEGWKIVVSTVTPTGQALAKKLFPQFPVIYFPFDLSGSTKRTLEAIRPSMILLMETEIWPNLILSAWESRIPVGIVNGRLSPRSYKRYCSLRSLFRGILNKISFFLVQFQWDSDRLQEIGVDASKILITGNMKFDVSVGADQDTAAGLKSRFLTSGKEKIIIAGSTHNGEESILIEVFRKLRFEFPDLKLLIAPRHVQRAGKITRLVERSHFRCQLASQGLSQPVRDILILDAMGELKKWYAAADLVFMGGSLVKHGGQNPIEAALFGKPILFGPHVFNFQMIYEAMLKEKAGIQVYNDKELYEFLRKMLLEPSFAKEMGAKALQLIEKFQGATQRNADFVRHFLKDGKKDWAGEELTLAR